MGATHKPFWMVYGAGQRAPAFQHQSQHAAVTEARRLAQQHPGIRFFVLAAVRGFVLQDPLTEIAMVDEDLPW